jgi:trehalose 6-phosphate phosphatase
VRPGKMVIEIVPVSSNKGAAIRRLMVSPPFKGRRPLFAGDDTADEAAIDAVQAMGGTGIRIVDAPGTPTCARIVVPAAQIVRDWLALAH